MSSFLLRVVEYRNDRHHSTDDIPFRRVRRPSGGPVLVFTERDQHEAEFAFSCDGDGRELRFFMMNDRGDNIDSWSLGPPLPAGAPRAVEQRFEGWGPWREEQRAYLQDGGTFNLQALVSRETGAVRYDFSLSGQRFPLSTADCHAIAAALLAASNPAPADPVAPPA